MFEKSLIKYASPTLAGIKTGNLFKIYLDENTFLEKLINKYNILLNPSGIFFLNVLETESYALIYVYRLKYLVRDLSKKDVYNFLKIYGYNSLDINSCLDQLKNRFLLMKKTPNEVGIFLGYPLDDVKGFIINKGNNYKLSGCWKVYNNVDKCKYCFYYYKKCTENYINYFNSGYTLESLVYKSN